MKLKVKRLSASAILPKKAHPSDAAFDLAIPRDTVIVFGRQVIPLDIAIELPMYHQAMVESRSNFSLKGMTGYETADMDIEKRFNADVLSGKIDSGYRGNIGVIVYSRETLPFILKAGTRIAQLTIELLPNFESVEEVDVLSDADRGEGGFGSTGTKKL